MRVMSDKVCEQYLQTLTHTWMHWRVKRQSAGLDIKGKLGQVHFTSAGHCYSLKVGYQTITDQFHIWIFYSCKLCLDTNKKNNNIIQCDPLTKTQ